MRPFFLIPEGFRNQFLAVEICGGVSTYKEGIMIQQCIQQRLEQPGITAGKQPASYQLEYLLQLGIPLYELPGIVSLPGQVRDLLGSVAEQKEIFGTDCVPDFDIGSVQRADGQRTIH